jgi:hypothetical protein
VLFTTAATDAGSAGAPVAAAALDDDGGVAVAALPETGVVGAGAGDGDEGFDPYRSGEMPALSKASA